MAFLYIRMLLLMFVSLYTSRIVLQNLGVTDFGIYNIVGGLVTMFSFINSSMRLGTQRFLNISIDNGDGKDSQLVFGTSIIIHLLTAFVILIIAETIGLWFFIERLVITSERFAAASWVYQSAILSTIIMIVSVPYDALIIAEERMSVFAILSIVEAILRLGTVYLLGLSNIDKLILFSVLNVVVQLLLRISYIVYCYRYFPTVRFHFHWDKQLFLSMTKFSFWSFNSVFAFFCCSHGLNILLNIFFGPVVNAAYGIASTVRSKVMLFCNNFQTAFNPPITKCHILGETERMHRLVIVSSKFSYYLLLLISLPIIVNISPLLDLWLTTVPKYTKEFTIIIITITMIRALATPLIISIHATGDIKQFQLWESISLLLVLPITYILLKYVGITPILVMIVYLFGELVAQVIRTLPFCPK